LRPVEPLVEEPPRRRDDRADLLHRPVEETAELVDGSADPVIESPVKSQDVLDVARQSLERRAKPLALDASNHRFVERERVRVREAFHQRPGVVRPVHRRIQGHEGRRPGPDPFRDGRTPGTERTCRHAGT
jgi:hypothetical protein